MRLFDIKEYLYFLVSIFLFLVFTTMLYIKFDQIVSFTKTEFEKIMLNDLKHISKVVENNLNEGPLKQDFINDRKNLDKFLSTFIDEEHKYVYMIYKDGEGNFRYFADGAKSADERGEFGQVFYPLEEKKWDYAFKKEQALHIIQNKIDSLWITYLYPLHFLPAFKTFLVMDVSTKAYKQIEFILGGLKKFLKYLLIFLSGIFVFILILYFLVYKEYQKTYFDPLTKVYNRAFLNKIEKNINLNDYAVAMVDLDYFKNINDLYGHEVGDRVLKSVAETISQNIGGEDILIRYGGEEFLLMLKKGKNIKKLIRNIHKIIENRPIKERNFTIRITASIGLNELAHLDNTLSEAIKKADIKLYQAKTQGRNKIKILDESQHSKSENLVDFEKITELISTNQMEIYYQAIIDVKTLDISKYEALARLKYEKRLIYPAIFLPVILRTNYYIDFTIEVLNRVFAKIKSKNIEISVNFKKSDFLDNKLLERVKGVIRQNEDVANLLVLEILEDEEVKSLDREFFKILNELKGLGCKIALDDFGSGYSNLSYFLHIEPDIIKIDGSIIRELPSNDKAVKIVKSIAVFSKYINAKTVAEFVENGEIFEMVKEIGIDYAQGYYFGKPQKDI